MDATNVRRRAISLVVILVLYFVFDSSPAPQASNKEIERALTAENAAWHVLNSSSYGDFNPQNGKWLNLTGFDNETASNWRLLLPVQARARDYVARAVGSEHSNAIINGQISITSPLQFYYNVTGEVKGAWKRVKDLTAPQVEVPNQENDGESDAPHRLHHNITGDIGTLQLSFKEAGLPDEWHGLNARGLRARMLLHGDGMADSFSMILTGMHILETGSILLVTHGAKFPALFGLPHLALSERLFLAYQHRLNRTLKDVIDLQTSRQLKTAAPWSPSPDNLDRRYCNLLIYIQQYPLSPQHVVHDVENELRYPWGAPKIGTSPPPLKMNMVSYSPDCGYVFESTDDTTQPSVGKALKHHLSGDKLEVYNNRVRKHSLVFAIVVLLQTLSIIRQTKDASTPSMKNRISVKTMLVLNIADGLVALSFVPTVALTDSLFTPMATVSFVAVICGVYFNLPFLASIWAVQHEEVLRERRQQRSSAPSTNQANAPGPRIPVITAAGLDSLPLPVTAGPAAAVIGADGEELEDNEGGLGEPRSIVQSRLGFIIVSLWIFSIWMTTTSSFIQQGYFFILSTVYVSCWVPQIVRNAMRNCRKALRWDFVTSQSILRLVPVMYFYGYDKNLAENEPSFVKATFLISLSWIQICVLAGQYIFGPRLLVPKSWLPPAYDYHPILREDDESTRIILDHASSPTSPTFKHSHGSSTGAEVKESKNKRVFDCAICMQGVEVPIIPSHTSVSRDGQKHESVSQTSFLWQRSYMITPCRHVFHTRCLEMAMRFRLQCPLCREGLPPL